MEIRLLRVKAETLTYESMPLVLRAGSPTAAWDYPVILQVRDSPQDDWRQVDIVNQETERASRDTTPRLTLPLVAD